MPAPITTIAEARHAFDKLGLTVKQRLALKAQEELRIAEIKAETAPTIETLSLAEKEIGQRILTFIRKNKKQFADPRSIQTAFGSFGLRQSHRLYVDDGADKVILAWLMENGYTDCFKPPNEPTIIKNAIRERMARGETIPQCTIKEIETAFADIDEELAKAEAH